MLREIERMKERERVKEREREKKRERERERERKKESIGLPIRKVIMTNSVQQLDFKEKTLIRPRMHYEQSEFTGGFGTSALATKKVLS